MKHFILLFSIALSALSATAMAQQPCTHCTIAITQIISHPSLNLVQKGIMDTLAAHGYARPAHRIEQSDAAGNIANAVQIAKHIAALSPDVAIAIATPSAQSLIRGRGSRDFPILFSSVTDPIGAKLLTHLAHPDRGVTGVRNVPPFEDNLLLLQTVMPNAKRLGLVINKGESNSVTMETMLREIAKRHHMQLVTTAVSSGAEIASAALSLVRKVDAFIVIQDNTVAAALPALAKVAFEHRIPFIGTFPEAVDQGALFAVAYDEYQIGRLTAEMAVKILKGQAVEALPVATPTEKVTRINKVMAKKLGLVFPASVIAVAQKEIPEKSKISH
jgi:putative ABC transport system substrate-binding protein